MVSLESLIKFSINYGLDKGAEYVESRYEKRMGEKIILRNGEVEGLIVSNTEGINIRLVYDGVVSMGSSNILTKSYLENVIDELVSMARANKVLSKRKVSFSEEPALDISYFLAENIKCFDLSVDEKVNFLKELDSQIEDSRFKVKFFGRSLFLDCSKVYKLYENSEETKVESQIPYASLFYLITGKYNEDSVQKYGEFAGSGGFEVIKNDKTYEELYNVASVLDKLLLEGVSPPTGRMDAVVSSEVAGIIAHEAVGHPFEADRVLGRESAQAGRSYISPDMIGKRVGSGEVNVSDDPTIPGSYGFYLYDDEGVKARKRILIKEGVVNELLHNRETANAFDTNSNGAARGGGFDKEPIVRMANTFFEPGDYSIEELVEDIVHGVYIKSFMEWNIDDIRLNQRYTGLEAYIIENGEITKPIKNPVIEINTLDLLSKLDARGNSLKFYPGNCGKGDPMQSVPVWMGGPDLRFRNIYISKR